MLAVVVAPIEVTWLDDSSFLEVGKIFDQLSIHTSSELPMKI